MGTTRPVSPGWRAESSTTSVRSATPPGGSPSSSAASCALAAQKSNCARASSVSRSSVRVRRRRAPTARRGSRPSSSSTAACASRHALPSSTTTSGSTNSVWPLPDASWTMPLTLARASARIGHDVAPVAQRDDRLLERAAQLRAHERVQAAPEPVVGDADRGPQRRRAAARRCPAARPTGSKLRGERAAQGRQRVEAPAEVAQQRPAFLGERRREPRGRVERLRRSRGTAAGPGGRRGPRGRPTARCRGPRRCRRRPAPGAARAPGRSRRGARATMTGSADGSSASARRRDGSNDVFSARRARTAGNSSSAMERASISAPRRSADGLPATTSRHGTRDPRLARVRDARPAGSRRSCGAGSPPGAGSRRSGEAGSHRSRPVWRGRCRRRPPTSPGPAASRASRRRPGRRPGGRRRRARRAWPASPSRGSTARMSSAAGRGRLRSRR